MPIQTKICPRCHVAALRERTEKLDNKGWVHCHTCGFAEKKETN